MVGGVDASLTLVLLEEIDAAFARARKKKIGS